jgi:hypothetical protein
MFRFALFIKYGKQMCSYFNNIKIRRKETYVSLANMNYDIEQCPRVFQLTYGAFLKQINPF